MKDLIANWPVEKLGNWPKAETEKQDLKQRFQKFLSDDFDITNLALRIDPKAVTLSDVLITGNFAKILVHEKFGEYLAILIRNDRDEWLLQQLTFQCITCFGVGIYGEEICNVCGGAGWGTLGDVEFCNGR